MGVRGPTYGKNVRYFKNFLARATLFVALVQDAEAWYATPLQDWLPEVVIRVFATGVLKFTSNCLEGSGAFCAGQVAFPWWFRHRLGVGPNSFGRLLRRMPVHRDYISILHDTTWDIP